MLRPRVRHIRSNLVSTKDPSRVQADPRPSLLVCRPLYTTSLPSIPVCVLTMWLLLFEKRSTLRGHIPVYRALTVLNGEENHTKYGTREQHRLARQIFAWSIFPLSWSARIYKCNQAGQKRWMRIAFCLRWQKFRCCLTSISIRNSKELMCWDWQANDRLSASLVIITSCTTNLNARSVPSIHTGQKSCEEQ